jgi:putative flavoprotein involved in K+ transport
MELNYWVSSECVHAEYAEEKSEWVVDVVRYGARTTLRPKQLVFATGAYGPPNVISLPGVETFQGRHCHSSDYETGEPYAGKASIVVGSNSSAHDIAADLWDYGAKVTMLQRSPTTVVRSETLMELGFEPLYSESALRAGITTDKADLIFAATPFRIMHRGQIPIYGEIRRRDAPFYARLAKSGFKSDFGEDESGLMMKALRTGSGYYIDVGASDLIARGDVAIRSGVEIRCVKECSVELTDGSELPADLIVMATGFQSMNRSLVPIISEEVANKVGKCWGLGCAATLARGEASRATCGSRRNNLASGFTEAISRSRDITLWFLRFRLRRAWRDCRWQSTVCSRHITEVDVRGATVRGLLREEPE